MKAFWTSFGVALVCSTTLVAQERDRSAERIALALQQASLSMRDPAPDTDLPKQFGGVTLVPPVARGEIVRVSISIGNLVARGLNGVTATHHRRQQAAARRKVDAELKAFLDQQAAKK